MDEIASKCKSVGELQGFMSRNDVRENMEIKQITDLIENFAPLELQEAWDNCGWQIEVSGQCDVKKILLCVSVTQDIINQAVSGNFDLIIAHHPFIYPFFIPFEFNKNIPIYSAHTNLDKCDGGTTDTMIEDLELRGAEKFAEGEFLRLVQIKEPIQLEDFVKLLKEKLNIENLRVILPVDTLTLTLTSHKPSTGGFARQSPQGRGNKRKISRIAFCAGSGADFLQEAEKAKADAFVTGDVKYHTALESNVIIIDAGHFESERPVLKKIKKILEPLNLEVVEADEKSPFINY